MQSSPNDIYRPPTTSETSATPPVEQGSYNSLEIARQNRISEAKADLERYYFAKTALADKTEVRQSSLLMAGIANIEQKADYVREILPYVKHLGEFINYEREEVVKNGWSV